MCEYIPLRSMNMLKWNYFSRFGVSIDTENKIASEATYVNTLP